MEGPDPLVSADAADGLPEEVMTELRRQIFARLAVTRPDGSLMLCTCSYTRARYGMRPKITYADYDDARTAALALVKLPGATPVRLYPCYYEKDQWHHTGKLGKGKAGRKLTVYPPSWVDECGG
jgi:hypothetical protein